jgi:predicted nuclease of predicted toxin-antitoxin system
VRRLSDLYPGSAHVRAFTLQTADDKVVWQHARDAGFAIVAKDDDFRQLAFTWGAPPKVIWVRLGNCTTGEIESVLRSRHADVLAFEADPAAALLVLTRPA